MNDMNQAVADLAAMLLAHKWLGAAALVVGLLTRLVKDDTRFPIDLPAKYRPWLALGLGLAAGALDKVVEGKAWSAALTEGLVAGVLAILGQNLLIESLRGGKELPLPGLMKQLPPATDDRSGILPKIESMPPDALEDEPPPDAGFANFELLFGGAVSGAIAMAVTILMASSGCSAAQNKRLGLLGLDLAQKSCIIANALLGDDSIKTLCKVVDMAAPEVRELVDAGRKAALAQEKAGYGKGIPLQEFQEPPPPRPHGQIFEDTRPRMKGSR